MILGGMEVGLNSLNIRSETCGRSLIGLVVWILLKCWFVSYNLFYVFIFNVTNIWIKVFKNAPSKICGRQPLKNFKWYGLLSCIPQILLGPFLNTFNHMKLKSYICIQTEKSVARSLKFQWSLLTQFSLIFHFYTLWKRQRTFGFPMFSGGKEKKHWAKIG